MIGSYVLRQPMRTLRVQVICNDSTTLLCSRDSEWPHTGEHVCNNILGCEQLNKTIVFSV